MMEKVFETIPAQELYGRTGIQFARLNTLFQLARPAAGRAGNRSPGPRPCC